MIGLVLNHLKERKSRIESEYMTRLSNSASGFCGCSHVGEGPFLTVSEIESIIKCELDKVRVNEQLQEVK